MPATITLQMRRNPDLYMCGLACWHPAWMQRFATTKMFMIVYGLLGTIQAMAYMYFIVTMTTIEKRFKIPSQTTGIILSGNEISQILLSLILSYVGGQRNRPRWIAWGVVFCGISCYILVLPHFIYGAGNDVLKYTKEYADEMNMDENVVMSMVNSTAKTTSSTAEKLCGALKLTQECEAILTIVPLILIFLSQFVLGIGNTLYYSLGQTYLDDNTKKTNTPLMLAIAMALRMIGPIFGFFIGYISLNMFVDPTRTPLIDSKDPRWLGAWWFGWVVQGTLMCVFAGLIGLFPKQLPKNYASHYNSHIPQVLRIERELDEGEGLPMRSSFSSNATLDHMPPAADTRDFPKLKDFPAALMRLIRNKLLIYNILSGVFYILGGTAVMTFLTKYMEVVLHKNASNATIIVGPVSIVGIVIGLIFSGMVISKYKPSPSKLLMWNVIVGCIYVIGQFQYIFLYCADSVSVGTETLNFTKECNSNCGCDDAPYSPMCHLPSDTTYFSPCHAGCHSWNEDNKMYFNCSCLAKDFTTSSTPADFLKDTTSFSATNQTLPKLLKQRNGFQSSLPALPMFTTPAYLNDPVIAKTSAIIGTTTTTTSNSFLDGFSTTSDNLLSRTRRSIDELADVLTPGVCMKGCNFAFYSFAITSMITNWFGSSGRVGNVLVNYRAVQTEDKSIAQGLSLMMVSLIALIPGPIIFGYVIDSTCLIWTETCNGKGNCQLYDQTKFRIYINILAMVLTAIGVAFDILVWYHGRHLDLYGDKEKHHMEEMRHMNKAITPLLTKKPINK